MILILSSGLYGQKKDSTKVSYGPTGVRIGGDLVSVIKSHGDFNFSGSEYSADIDFWRYYLTVETGKWAMNTEGNEPYDNNGTYFRVGVDINFLLKDPDRNMFFIGGRYGHSDFSETLHTNQIDSVWGAQSVLLHNDDVKAHWLEITAGLKVKIWRWFWMGYTARYKFGLSTKGNGELESYDVPGYGRTFRDTSWGFNYQLYVRIPLRKQQGIKSPK